MHMLCAYDLDVHKNKLKTLRGTQYNLEWALYVFAFYFNSNGK